VAGLWIEPVSREQRVCLLAATRGIGLAGESGSTTREESKGSDAIRFLALRRGTLHEHFIHDGLGHSLDRELAAQRHLSARSCAIATLDPRLRKGAVIQVVHLDKPLDNGLDERLRISQVQ
jgi:hypothetical protein